MPCTYTAEKLCVDLRLTLLWIGNKQHSSYRKKKYNRLTRQPKSWNALQREKQNGWGRRESEKATHIYLHIVYIHTPSRQLFRKWKRQSEQKHRNVHTLWRPALRKQIKKKNSIRNTPKKKRQTKDSQNERASERKRENTLSIANILTLCS